MCLQPHSPACNDIDFEKLNLPLHMSTGKPKWTVRFNQVVHVAPFQRASEEEASKAWYSNVDVARMKAVGREMALSYRKVEKEKAEGDAYRGFEGYTFLRQRQRLLSNRCAVYASKQNLDASITSTMYKQCNQWSCDIAFIQAMHDFVEAYGDGSNRNYHRNTIPSITSILPPPDLPFAVQGFLVLQSQRKSKVERKLKRRATTAGIRRVRQRVC